MHLYRFLPAGQRRISSDYNNGFERGFIHLDDLLPVNNIFCCFKIFAAADDLLRRLLMLLRRLAAIGRKTVL